MSGNPSGAGGRNRNVGTIVPCPQDPQNCPKETRPRRNFISGINFPWFEGQYDHDFGDNSVMTYIRDKHLRQLNVMPPSGPITAYYNSGSHKDKLLKYFDTMSKMGFSVVRIWAFERFEGLKFKGDGSVDGIENNLKDNFKEACALASSKELKVYICLLDTWALWGDIKFNNTQLSDQLKKELVQALDGLIKDDSKCDSYINNAVVPLLSGIPADSIFAVDVLNEPEGILKDERGSNWNYSDLTWKRGLVQNFIKRCARAIHEHNDLKDKNIKVSCGLQKKDNIDKLRPLGVLDFYDYHEYSDTGYLDQWKTGDKPCIVGECNVKNYSNDPQEALVIEAFFNNAIDKGYAGCLVWSFETNYTAGDKEKEKSVVKPNGAPKQPVCVAIKCFNKNRVNKTNTI